jgi:hypothetical protein
MRLAGPDRIASALAGVTRRSSGGLARWRYQGRLVARQLDGDARRAPRHQLLSRYPATFEVPARYERHMVVADLESGDAGAIEDALMAAWALQAGHG